MHTKLIGKRSRFEEQRAHFLLQQNLPQYLLDQYQN